MTQTVEEKNKAFVLEAFETLFNKKDYATAERFWSPSYIQHSKHIPPGRDGLFGLVKASPETMRYENGTILAERNLLMLHGRFSGLGMPTNWVVVDIVRLDESGRLAEHWDVIEDEATRETSLSGQPMFGAAFPSELAHGRVTSAKLRVSACQNYCDAKTTRLALSGHRAMSALSPLCAGQQTSGRHEPGIPIPLGTAATIVVSYTDLRLAFHADSAP